jgi:hypothetical protein
VASIYIFFMASSVDSSFDLVQASLPQLRPSQALYKIKSKLKSPFGILRLVKDRGPPKTSLKLLRCVERSLPTVMSSDVATGAIQLASDAFRKRHTLRITGLEAVLAYSPSFGSDLVA